MIKDISDYPCPSCGFIVFDEPPGSYAICPVCGWEDDHVQLRYPTMGGGANEESLFEHQKLLLDRVPLSTRVHAGHFRDANWRPLRSEECGAPRDAPETGLEYFEAAAEDSPQYYWRKQK